MIKSIIDDIKQNFFVGNMVTKLIIVNVIIFVVAALLVAFNSAFPFYRFIEKYFTLNAFPKEFLYRPWTLITHMFLHLSFFHVLWNMVGLNVFGSITGDLIGDRKILPLYLFGGVVAAVTFIISFHLIGSGYMYHTALGASGAVMAIVMVAGLIAPDYIIRLLLIGDVKIKYLVFAFIFFDIIGSQGINNAGGHFAHLGGALGGFLYIYFYKRDINLLAPFEYVIGLFEGDFTTQKQTKPRRKLTVEHRSDALVKKMNTHKTKTSGEMNYQERLDFILDKIKVVGYEKLSTEDKEFLKNASKHE
jgi:membrane associated rhomboid family serine protease